MRQRASTWAIAGASTALVFGCGDEPESRSSDDAPVGGAGGTAGARPAAGAGAASPAGSSGSGRGGNGGGGQSGRGGASAGTNASSGGNGGNGLEGGTTGESGDAGFGGEPSVALDCAALPAPHAHEARLFSAGDDPSADPECTDVLNPERGFFRFLDLRSLGNADDLRTQGFTLFYGRALLDDYREQELDASVLDTLAESFDEARSAGVKVLPRFYYADDGSSPDAPLERVLSHIDELAPLLDEHADVIAALQAGFVGAWGEWHGSTNDLTEPENRKTIFDALLAALPSSRMVLARRPSHKLAAYGGPLDETTAFREDPLARLGHLNDCFLASEDDMGTYQEPGEKTYAAEDSAFTAVGGETCAVNPPRSDCATAEGELALHHFSFLNVDYHPDVLDAWSEQGCFERIRCRLGYRFALLAHASPESAARGSTQPLYLELVNDGYARAYNRRLAQLVLGGTQAIRIDLPLDVRSWEPGVTSEHCLSVPLPATVEPGIYRLGLAFPDPELEDDPRFAVRLSSGAEWDETLGVNWLDTSVTIAE